MNIIKPNIKFTNPLQKRTVTDTIVLHHASASVCDAITIDRWHKQNGWSGIGYHFVVRKNGTVEEGRPIDTTGAHCLNHNNHTIGICFEGDFEKEDMHNKQKQAGIELIAYIKKKYGNIPVKKHKDFMATDCPGKNFPFDEIVNAKVAKKSKSKKKYTGTLPTLPSRGYFGKGDKGEQVKLLQTFLNWYGGYNLVVDGDIGSKTISAVKDYQKREYLVIDGLFGHKCLNRAKNVKA